MSSSAKNIKNWPMQIYAALTSYVAGSTLSVEVAKAR